MYAQPKPGKTSALSVSIRHRTARVICVASFKKADTVNQCNPGARVLDFGVMPPTRFIEIGKLRPDRQPGATSMRYAQRPE